jgi:hypothetical protein
MRGGLSRSVAAATPLERQLETAAYQSQGASVLCRKAASAAFASTTSTRAGHSSPAGGGLCRRISFEMEQHMMNQHAGAVTGAGVWECGLSLADFEVPSRPTQVATVAPAIASVTIDLADARSSRADEFELLDLSGVELPELPVDLTGEATAAWAEPGEDLDFQDRKILWPRPDPASYSPSTSVPTRIDDNICAIILMQELASAKRQATSDEMAQLLRYSGWGGASRVFSPDGSAQHRMAAQRDQLKALVTPAEYTAMQASVNTAFYTPPDLVRSIWQMVEHLGFNGGRIIEPAAGVGHFLATMPAGMARKSSITAVEKDPVSAALLEANLAPYGVQVHASGLEDAKLPLGFFDLVIGNIPFGNFKTNDTSKAPYADWLIHNWFLGKSIELVRPGGLVVLITSAGSLDSKSDAHRKWLAAHADLVAAFRLPTTAFKDHANTEAVTDLLVLRRRELPDFSSKPHWLDAEDAEGVLFDVGISASVASYHQSTGQSYTKRQQINKHFNRNPAAMLGKLRWESGQHGPSAVPVLAAGSDELLKQLDAQVMALPTGAYKAGVAELIPVPQSPMARYANDERAMPGTLVLAKGRICISEGDEVLDVDGLYTGTARKRVLGMIEIRRAALKVIQQQATSNDDAELTTLQRRLSGTYDTFAAQLGPLMWAPSSNVTFDQVRNVTFKTRRGWKCRAKDCG